MRLTVFGSTGSIGQRVVAQALEQGHHVTAFARSADKFKQPHANLEIVEGDALDPAAVERAIEGRDVVICALGMPLMNKDGLRAKGTANIVRAMEAVGVKRLICLSSLGAGDSRGVLPFHYRYILAPLMMRRLFADHEAQEMQVRNSRLDWTIVRPGNFIKGKRTGAYKHGFTAAHKALKLKISREDVADFILKQVADNAYLRRSPGLSY